MDKLFSINETLEILKVSRATLYRLISEKKIKTVKIGNRTFVLSEEIDSFIAKLRNKGKI
ncbi:MAG: helix-turn-helix domain-containing protein [Thermodesulfovibrionales bacterium]|nr:helix-turn-helix domain-containing protein [Thermodesulfovibrionales bacterium]